MIDVRNIETYPPKSVVKEEIESETKKMVKEIGELSRIFEADKSHSLLIVLQGMDSSGKDGISRKIFRNVSPTVICEYGFKKPSPEESNHDFLWRVHKQVPEKGHFKIFNRSHYEDVLVQRVHNWIDEEKVAKRFKAIRDFEDLLEFDGNTTILKFFLHISHKKQQEKLNERIEKLEKNWKYNPNDFKESELWDKYMDAYNDVVNQDGVQWHIIPADKQWYRDYNVAKVVRDTLKKMDLKYPKIDI
ncbi:MAG: polyphosphate kinase [Saprospiraceae bacterium]